MNICINCTNMSLYKLTFINKFIWINQYLYNIYFVDIIYVVVQY